jgi:hypothetical protein
LLEKQAAMLFQESQDFSHFSMGHFVSITRFKGGICGWYRDATKVR